MSLAELRAELKNLRKSANPVPASRMKKASVAMEIARLKGLSAPPSTPEKEVAPAPKKEVAPKKEKVAKKVEEKKEAPADAPKKTKGVKSTQEVVIPTMKDAEKKPAKGSEEMKERMKALREKRKAKKDE
jgi:hypothetical protein